MIVEQEINSKQKEQRSHINSEIGYWKWLLDNGYVLDCIKSIKRLTERIDSIGD